jgi:hypothetical protein
MRASEDGQRPLSGTVRSLILRAWLEQGTGQRIRVRVVEIDPGPSERAVIITASIDDACHTVRRWLEAQARDTTDTGQ